MPLGERLSGLLDETGLSQKSVAKRSDLPLEAVNRIVRGRTKDPQWSTMTKLLRDGFGVSLDAFAGGIAETKLNPYDTDPQIKRVADILAPLDKRDRLRIVEFVEWVAESLSRGDGDHATSERAEPYNPRLNSGKTDAPKTSSAGGAGGAAAPANDARPLNRNHREIKRNAKGSSKR